MPGQQCQVGTVGRRSILGNYYCARTANSQWTVHKNEWKPHQYVQTQQCSPNWIMPHPDTKNVYRQPNTTQCEGKRWWKGKRLRRKKFNCLYNHAKTCVRPLSWLWRCLHTLSLPSTVCWSTHLLLSPLAVVKQHQPHSLRCCTPQRANGEQSIGSITEGEWEHM